MMFAFFAAAGSISSYLLANGLTPLAWSLLVSIFAFTGMFLIFRFIWLFRGAVKYGLTHRYAVNDEQPPFRIAVFADTWHWMAIIYVAFVIFLVCFKTIGDARFVYGAGFYSLMLIPVIILIDMALGRLLVGRSRGRGPKRRSVVRNVSRFLLVGFGGFTFFRLWGLDLSSSMQSSLGPVITRALVEIGVILLIAYLIWELFRSWIDRKIAEEIANLPEGAEEEAEGPGGTGLSRLATLLPIVKSFMTVTFMIIVGLTLLRSLGVDIAPLLAGAGILGLAIGFGSQTLVRDIVAGVFFLIDDAFRVGEYVESGSLKGTVERLGIRSIRLRHHRGMVHTIPYGELSAVTNYSRDWVIMKLEFRLPYGTDMEIVRKAIKKTGQEMASEEQFADSLLAPLKSQGVVRTEQSALVFRAKFTAKPGGQFVIRREAFRRIQEALDAAGVETFAPHQVAVRIADAPAASSGPVMAAAAAGAVAGALANPDDPSGGSDKP